MDGNGRWANERNQIRIFGHYEGAKTVKRIVKEAHRQNIEVLSLFAFSCENWNRPDQEVKALFELFAESLTEQAKDLNSNNVKFNVIGDLSDLSAELQDKIKEVENVTSANTGLNLVVAINYSGRWDITNAARKLGEKVKDGSIDPSLINEQDFSEMLSLCALPDPDLLIRTSGEQRISNFMLWQFAYTELYFTDVYWPDFSEDDFRKALDSYCRRDRRFGLVAETPNHDKIV